MATTHQIGLTSWHKNKPRCFIIFFAGLPIQLHSMVSQPLEGNIEPLLTTAKAQVRDALLTNAVWGDRNTSNNRSNHAWPMLKYLQAAAHKRIPKFIVHPANRGLTGDLPAKTGIYVCADDPNASLQFIWSKNGGAQLRKANTCNEIAREAIRHVGGDDL